MLNASQIFNLIPENGSLVLYFTRSKEGQMTVVVDPRYPKSDSRKENEMLQEALSPKTVTGSPEMLDSDFMAYLTKTITAAKTLIEQIEAIDKETEDLIGKAKAEASKKIAEASKNKSKSGSGGSSKQAAKSSPSPSPSATQAVLGEEDEGVDENAGEEPAAESKPKEEKAEAKAPALSLF